jgi:hypothetical protein
MTIFDVVTSSDSMLLPHVHLELSSSGIKLGILRPPLNGGVLGTVSSGNRHHLGGGMGKCDTAFRVEILREAQAIAVSSAVLFTVRIPNDSASF